ncbi:zinc metallopeptidase [uncultured Cytophaga sp.]|uniref:zinc metallopeptidase n=1 Tax=uncultured Cytophaga sp. TaxID=160238 RepID=UPI0026397C3A|nr:zinc metallopeptidase [uncultured Cytophaga sp.]
MFPIIFVISIATMLASWYVSNKLKNKFELYSRIPLLSGMSGKEVAEQMLRDNRIYDVKVISVEGRLTDHYNPSDKTVNLSSDVYAGRSAASAAVAAHECGHALQHAQAYSMLELRSTLVPIQNISAKALNILMMVMIFGGMLLVGPQTLPYVLLVIIACNLVITLFALITLPVEFDASNRALAWIESRGITNSQEHAMAKDALKWAARSYIVVAIGAFAQLLYYVMMFLGLSKND